MRLNMVENIKLKKEILEHVSELKSAEDIYDLFELLNYPKEALHDVSAKRKKESFEFKKEDLQRIKEIYSILSLGDLHVFLIEGKTLTPSFIRSVTATFDNQQTRFLLIFTVDYSEVVFVLPKRERIEAGKHKLRLIKLIIDKEEILNKKEHYTVVETLTNIFFKNESEREIWKKWNKAFSVERVTDAFFDDYKKIFFTLRQELDRQGLTKKEAHEFTLQFLNRIMFIYFISKKKWLEYPKFIEWLWMTYKKKGLYGSNEFYEKWLKEIFFKAFNNRASDIDDLPNEVVKVILKAPYLNGGLFKENELDVLNVEISDELFQRVFEFFEKYNFTIKEDVPLDQEVAVDPQMIGYVYESLANVAEEIYDRNDLGIFYTPRAEVDFMSRRALVEYLSKNLEDVPKDKIYHLVFDLPEEKEKIEKWFNEMELWYKLEAVLDRLSAVDPACGSGAFLVGLLNVLTEIYKIIYKHLKRDMTDFNLKKRIIQYSLYGVDVMPWAIHAAELRLWLQLIVETNFKKDELKKNPLLPNLNLNLRIGDSLVQEIGGINFNLRSNNLKPFLKNQLEDLKNEKRKYFVNDPTAKYKSPEDVRAEEIRLFREIINERIDSLKSDIEFCEGEIRKAKSQRTLTGDFKVDMKIVKENEEIIKRCEKEIKKLEKIEKILNDPEKKPFVWDIDFAEVFSEKGGFDIVIGNPPYVKQEDISPPNRLKAEVTLKDRQEYKDKLIKSVKNIFPVISKLNKKSDYYIYFYFHGLGLLNEKGVLAFITSNSWLDVGYGAGLQEFLLKYVPILAIYDNPKRSFAHADVNTIIAFFDAPKFDDKNVSYGLKKAGKSKMPMLEHTAKFVMFKKPFEEVINVKNLIEIERIGVKVKNVDLIRLVENVVNTPNYRVFPVVQKDLLEDGWDYPEGYDEGKGRFKDGKYEGNKWGGKFLRAPEVFFTILKKGKSKLVKLGDVAKIETYLNTGGADKFYFVKLIQVINNDFVKIRNTEFNEDFDIEVRFLKPVIKSPQELSKIWVDKEDIKSYIVTIDEKEDLHNLKIRRYISFGFEKEYNRRSGPSSRNPWWKLPKQAREGSKILIPRNYDERIIIFYNPKEFISNRFYRVKSKIYNYLAYILNSTLNIFFIEIYGRKNLGQGALDIEKIDLKEIPIIKNARVKSVGKYILTREIKDIFTELGFDRDKPIREQEPNPLPDRVELDKIIFDELGLTEEERKEVYWAVAELVKQRLDKAKSLGKKGKKGGKE